MTTSTRELGRWALVAGASEGLGAAFADALGRAGHDLVLVARRADALEAVAEDLRARYGVEVRCVVQDLGSPDLVAALQPLAELELGVVVYNAAYAPVGSFVELPFERVQQVIDVNVRGLLGVVHTLAPGMKARGRGGLVLMSSLVGLLGGPRLATYAASKAFTVVLGESLWHELEPVQVVVCCAGAVRTPGYQAAAGRDAPGTLDASAVVEEALHGLGRGPRVIPGWVNRLAVRALGLLGRRRALRIMARNTEDLQ